MNEQRVKTDHGERDKYDNVIHSLFFLSTLSLSLMRIIGFSGFAIRWAKFGVRTLLSMREPDFIWPSARNAHDLASVAERDLNCGGKVPA